MLAFILALVAGALVPLVEGVLRAPIEGLASGKVELAPGETRTLAFIVLMLGVGIVGWVWNSGSVFWVILGGAFGLFALRVAAYVRNILEQRKAG